VNIDDDADDADDNEAEAGSCEWTEWSPWTECTVTCGGGGFIIRHRTAALSAVCHRTFIVQQKSCRSAIVPCPLRPLILFLCYCLAAWSTLFRTITFVFSGGFLQFFYY